VPGVVPSSRPLSAIGLVTVFFHNGVLVMVVVVVANHRTVVVVLLDSRMSMLDLVVMTVPMDRNTAGTNVHVLGECADGGEDEGDRGGEGGNRELHPGLLQVRIAIEMQIHAKPFRDYFRGVSVCDRTEHPRAIDRIEFRAAGTV
jgi:hypothetical protein